ncbi:MAG TPA: prepilin-type N-terminal cleavage/methylation domain-containing protein [bacterium]|nr:prepilin-type N-terminal cleavage/methylation domain-containing protein [bacterium]HPQ66593.1 prepilin-type N-terminal cleavage/methylation domain-containing protein [bacterium]
MRSRAEKSFPGARGFTLIEVMVAVALLGISLSPLLLTHGSVLKNFARSKERTGETLAAASALATVEAIGLPAAQGDYGGVVEEWEHLRWKAAVGEVAESLAQVEGVSFPEGGEEEGRKVAFSTYIVNLEYPEPEEKPVE